MSPKIVDLDLGDVDENFPPPVLRYYHGDFYEELKQCHACPLRQEARQVVTGDGLAMADFLFLGQNPGQDEDRDGRPFIGRAGKELDRWLELLELDRDKVVVSNIVKCATANNREPKPIEASFCRDLWLPRELAFLTQVSIIVTLGNPATKAVLGKSAQTTGALICYWATVKHGDRTYTVYPLAHPAYILRSTSHRDRLYNVVLKDLKTALQRGHSEAYERARRTD